MNKPPFEINEKILNLVTSITEKLTRLEISIDRKKDLYLRKSSKIKSVNSSCAIEANSLSEEEVTSVINGKIVLAPQREIKEVKNAYAAYEDISNYNPYDIKSFLKAHKILTTDLIEESGVFRKGDIGVYDGTSVIHMGARPEFVYEQIESLFTWAKDSELNPLIKSSIIHFEIEFIHPFSDGNGRIGRLWQSLVLYKYNEIFEYLPIETLIYEHQQKYYDALSKAEKEAEATVFIEFMLDMILKTIEGIDNIDYLKNIKLEYVKALTKTEKEVLNALIGYFEDNDYIDNENAVNLLNKSSANVRKYFNKFVKLNILIAEGENKGRKYKLNEEVIVEK